MDDRLFRMSIFVLSFCVLSLPVRRSAVFNIYHTFEYVIPVSRGGRRTCIERLARPRKDRNPGFKAAGRHINPSGFRSFVLLVPRRPKTGMTAEGNGRESTFSLGAFLWSIILSSKPGLHYYPQSQAASFRFSRERVSGKDRNPVL